MRRADIGKLQGNVKRVSPLFRKTLLTKGNLQQEKCKVLQNPRKPLPIWSKGKMSNDVAEAQALFNEAWPESKFGFSVKVTIIEAYRFMAPRLQKKLTYRRVETIRQGTARRIDGEEKDVLRLAVKEEHAREIRELRARLAYLDERLAASDEEFHQPTLEALRSQAHRQSSPAR